MLDPNWKYIKDKIDEVDPEWSKTNVLKVLDLELIEKKFNENEELIENDIT
jgi:hypothetical protein